MKIGQVTMCGDNYGACLQAFALQYVLKKLHSEIEYIRYSRTCSKEHASTFSKLCALGIRGLVHYLKEYSFIKKRKNSFALFREKYIVRSPISYGNGNDLNVLAQKYDAFICGSDMIWSEEFQEDWDFYFLNFAPKTKSFSYAPSFGKNALSEDNKNRVCNYLNEFSRITCREEGGVDLIKSISDIAVKQVLDPTMLLGMDEWNEVINTRERIVEPPFVFMYLFGEDDPARKQYISDIEKKYGKAYKLPGCRKEARKFPVDSIGPIEYLRLFRDAEFIVTDTFHGLMFSMIFNKQFVVLDRTDASKWAKYSDRMTSTLDMFGLANRYIFANKMNAGDLAKIDYDIVNQKISLKRKESRDYLNEIVESIK